MNQERSSCLTSTAILWTNRAILCQVALLVAFLVSNHLRLYPWNNLGSPVEKFPTTLAVLLPFGYFILGFALRIRWLMAAGTLYSYLWLALELRQWWLPYLFGPTPFHASFDWYFDQGFAETMRFLPEISGRPVPDLQHVVLQVLSLSAAFSMRLAMTMSIRDSRQMEAA